MRLVVSACTAANQWRSDATAICLRPGYGGIPRRDDVLAVLLQLDLAAVGVAPMHASATQYTGLHAPSRLGGQQRGLSRPRATLQARCAGSCWAAVENVCGGQVHVHGQAGGAARPSKLTS